MRVEGPTEDRRRFARWRVPGSLSGWIGRSLQVIVADVSMGGMLVEHPNIIRPGTVCMLTLTLAGEKVSLKCRIVRSGIYSQEAWPTGEQSYVYRTGLELVELSETSQRLMSEYIASLQGETAR